MHFAQNFEFQVASKYLFLKNEKINYYTFFDQRAGDGWRSNSQFYTKSGFGTITYHVNTKLDLSVEVLQSHIRSQQPGGLTDQQIATNPQQSLRDRNWMDITWTTPVSFSPSCR